jgi:hypothetical protein
MARTYMVTNQQWSKDEITATFAELQQQAREFRPENPPVIKEQRLGHRGWCVVECLGGGRESIVAVEV